MDLHPPAPRTDREMLVEIYQAMLTVQRTVVQLCDRIDSHDTKIRALEDWRTVIGDDCAVHTKQIDGLQKWRWTTTGGIAVVAAAATWTLTQVAKVFTGGP